MKKTFSKIVTFVLLLAITATFVAPNQVQAGVQYNKNAYTSLSASMGTSSIYIGSTKSIKLTNLKVSDKSVLVITSISYDSYIENGKSYYYANIFYMPKKIGTSTISYKYNGKTYKTKVNVVKYANPVKSIKVLGATENGSTELASLVKSNAMTNIEFSDNIGSKVVIKANSGWKISGFSMSDLTDDWKEIKNVWPESQKSSLTVSNIKNLNEEHMYILDIYFNNTKTGMQQRISYIISK